MHNLQTWQRARQINEGWAQLLARYEWQWFVTFTYDRNYGRRDWLRMKKEVRRCLNCFNKRFFGLHWYRHKETKGVHYFFALEGLNTGFPHVHMLVGAPRHFSLEERRWLKDWWEARYGRAEVAVPRNRDDVLWYVTKTAYYESEFDHSENLGARAKQ